MNILIKPLGFPKIGPETKIFTFFDGRIGPFDHLISCTSTLKPNKLPHILRSHIEEELIISLSGNLEILYRDFQQSQIYNSTPIEPGSFVYHSPFQTHTLHCLGPEAAQYLFFIWKRLNDQLNKEQGTFIYNHNIRDYANDKVSKDSHLIPLDGLSDLTRGSMRAHISRLEPGAVVEESQDSMAKIVLLLEGKLQIFKFLVNAPAFLFISADTTYRLLNPGERISAYYVFEFNS